MLFGCTRNDSLQGSLFAASLVCLPPLKMNYFDAIFSSVVGASRGHSAVGEYATALQLQQRGFYRN
jgi:hypothetical protein